MKEQKNSARRNQIMCMVSNVKNDIRKDTMRNLFQQFRENKTSTYQIDKGYGSEQRKIIKPFVPPLPKKDQVGVLSTRNRLAEYSIRYNGGGHNPKLYNSVENVTLDKTTNVFKTIEHHKSAADILETNNGTSVFQSVEEPSTVSRKKRVPFLLHGPSDKEITPGPSSYNIVYGDIQETLAKGKGVSFKGKNYANPIGLTEDTPGPAAYDTLVKRQTKNAFSIGRSRRENHSSSKSPGPADYENLKSHRIKGTVAFNSIKKPEIDSSVPGPGQYETALANQKKAPKYLFTTARRFQSSAEDLNSSVGPQSYKPNYDVYLPKRQAVPFTTAKRATSFEKERNDSSFTNSKLTSIKDWNILDLKNSLKGVPFTTEKRFKVSEVVIK